MGSQEESPTPSIRSKVSQVELIAWDPESTQHVERMRLQRIACGWKQEKVESWRGLQRAGKITLQWVVLTDDDQEKEAKLKKHIKAFQGEQSPLSDSATSFGGKPRSPSSPPKSFIPVGHISLDSEYENPELGGNEEGIYWIATFYVSSVLQGTGLGRAAMDTVEHMAISEPLCAKTLALSTIANEYEGREERWKAMAALGREPPKVSNQDWYARRGYEVYKRVDRMWSEPDPTGKMWYMTAVFMRKDIE